MTRSNVLRLAVAALTASLIACGGAEERKAAYLDKARQFYAEANYEKARLEFKNAIYIDPKDKSAHFGLAQAHEKLGDLPSAVGEYRNVLTLDENDVDARTRIGYIYTFAGADKLAGEEVDKLLQIAPGNPDALAMRAHLSAKAGDLGAALKDATAAHDAAPDNPQVTLVLASVYAQTREFGKSIELLKTALGKAPEDNSLLLQLAQIQVMQENYAGAIEPLQKAIRLMPENLKLRYLLAGVYLKQNRQDLAEQVLRQAVADLPNSDEAKTTLVDLIYKQAGKDAAIQQIQTFIKESKSPLRMKAMLASFYEAIKDEEQAKRVYEEIVADRYAASDDQAVVTAKVSLANLAVRRNDPDAARKILDEVIKANPRNEPALLLRGQLMLAAGDTVNAVSDFRAVLQGNANSAAARRLLARAHAKNNEPELARDNLLKAVEANPRDLEARYELAVMQARGKEYDKAEQNLELILKAKPGNPVVLDALFKVQLAQKDEAGAAEVAKMAKELNADSALGSYMSGLLYRSKSDLQASSEQFDLALQKNPAAVEPLTLLVSNYVQQGQLDRAVARVQKALQAKPDNFVAHNLLGEVLVAKKSYTAAIESFQRAIDLRPTWWVPYRNKAIAYLRSGANEDAIKAYQQGLAAAQQPDALAIDLAVLYEQQGALEPAIKLYEDVLRRDADHRIAANNLAMILSTYRDDAESIKRAEHLVATFKQSDDPAHLDTVGWVALRAGDAKAAVATLEKAAQKAPKIAVIHYHLGKAYIALGEAGKARQAFEAAVRLNQPFEGQDDAKAQLAKLGG